MSDPDYYLCDVCGDITTKRLRLTTDRCLDAAGSMEDTVEILDLCHVCATEALQNIIPMNRRGTAPYEIANKLISWAKVKRKAR